MKYDFSGWATRNDIECSDGRIIAKDAFIENDGQKVPLVWNHQHDNPEEVLGHALLENRPDGVYAYAKFNNTESGLTAKQLVINGDVDKLSIYANKLKTEKNKVVHGIIREVSLVLAGANPGAYIDSVIVHSDDGEEEEATIFTDEKIQVDLDSIDYPKLDNQAEEIQTEKELQPDKIQPEEIKHSEEEVKNMNEEKSIKDIFEEFTDVQKDAVYAIIGQAIEEYEKENKKEKEKENEIDNKTDKEGEKEEMKHNVFNNNKYEDELKHSEIISSAIEDGKRYGSMKESFVAHAAAENIKNLEGLFPEAKELYDTPYRVSKNESFVDTIMSNVKKTPFSRVKTTFADVTEETARARGYIKGSMKKDHVITLLKRVTTPTTVYIKGKMDRDDQIDITSMDVIAWIKKEMRKNLDRELAVAMLLGDGREPSDDSKINELNIRPILKDENFYSIKYEVKKKVDYNDTNANDSVYKGIVRAAIKARKDYKGSGNPTFFTTEDILSSLLLLEDTNGRRLYNNMGDLATAMRVSKIDTVPEMEKHKDLYGIIVNFADYTAGADKGGEVNMFDDFDIDYNQQKYLIETRMSGALTVPYSAIVLKKEAATGEVSG